MVHTKMVTTVRYPYLDFKILFITFLFIAFMVWYVEIQKWNDDGILKSESLTEFSVSVVDMKTGLVDIDFVENNLYTLEQDDMQLIQYARIKHLTPPSTTPYTLKGSGTFSDYFSSYVAKLFANQKNGIFIEAGANDGENTSHTLFLEKELGWQGLLVECNPTVVPYLKSKHRKAWIADVCLSTTNHLATLNFSNPVKWSLSGRIGKPWNLPVATDWKFFDVRAIPLYTLLASLGWKEIDYFSFDIEGQELNVLKTFPFDKVIFKLIIVEIQFYTEKERLELDTLLTSNQYVRLEKMQFDYVYAHSKFEKAFRDNNFT